ncbi:MAG: hypothetical protein R3D43_02215 [Tepidamorphaceae bacterium]|nr:hypothetical protein [Rhodobiaceae bacterium]
MTNMIKAALFGGAIALSATSAFAMHHLSVSADDQDVSGGKVTATEINTTQDGWLVVHRTGDDMKPGPVVGHAWIKNGKNENVTADLTEEVKSGEKLMLMVHGEDGGMKAGEFEYTLGAKEDGPIKEDGKLIMTVITAK